jgi:hypothetical protein
MCETVVFLILREHVFENDKISFEKEYSDKTKEEEKHIDSVIKDTRLDSF